MTQEGSLFFCRCQTYKNVPLILQISECYVGVWACQSGQAVHGRMLVVLFNWFSFFNFIFKCIISPCEKITVEI